MTNSAIDIDTGVKALFLTLYQTNVPIYKRYPSPSTPAFKKLIEFERFFELAYPKQEGRRFEDYDWTQRKRILEEFIYPFFTMFQFDDSFSVTTFEALGEDITAPLLKCRFELLDLKDHINLRELLSLPQAQLKRVIANLGIFLPMVTRWVSMKKENLSDVYHYFSDVSLIHQQLRFLEEFAAAIETTCQTHDDKPMGVANTFLKAFFPSEQQTLLLNAPLMTQALKHGLRLSPQALFNNFCHQTDLDTQRRSGIGPLHREAIEKLVKASKGADNHLKRLIFQRIIIGVFPLTPEGELKPFDPLGKQTAVKSHTSPKTPISSTPLHTHQVKTATVPKPSEVATHPKRIYHDGESKIDPHSQGTEHHPL